MTQIRKVAIDQLTAVTDVQLTDVTLISRGGVLYKINPIYLQGGLIQVKKTLTQAELQAMSTTPIVVQAALGAGTYIVPVEGGCTAYLDHNGTTYATATTLRLHHSGQTNYMAQTTASFITSAADRAEKMIIDSATPTNGVLYANTGLVASLNANATNNGGTVYLNLLLRVVTF